MDNAASSAPQPATFTPQLTTQDWNAEWRDLQKARGAVDDPAFWNERSKTFGCGKVPSPYSDQFLSFAGIRPDETVFDMGCGTGALALPLGMAGHEVTAADFSEGMLERLRAECAARGITTVTTKLLSWEDDWEACGVGPDFADVACASRSIATSDMRRSLELLTRTARKRACITLSTSSSPHADERLLQDLGLQSQLGRDFLYAFAILVDMGYHPEVRYINLPKTKTFNTRAQAREHLEGMVRACARATASASQVESALTRLDTWIDDNLVENENAGEDDGRGGVQGPLKLRNARSTEWAFIAWDKESRG